MNNYTEMIKAGEKGKFDSGQNYKDLDTTFGKFQRKKRAF
jgi:hypothetical protein